MIEAIVFCALFGMMEGLMFHVADYSKVDKLEFDVHYYLMAFRIVSVIGLFPFVLIPGVALLFPLVHDGYYYQTRNFFNHEIYPKGFFTNKSDTTTARLSFKLWKRIVFAALGVLYFVFVA